MSADDPHFRLRVPPELRDRIREAADANKRSMNAEIVARLEETFSGRARRIDKEYASLSEQLADVEFLLSTVVRGISESRLHSEHVRAHPEGLTPYAAALSEGYDAFIANPEAPFANPYPEGRPENRGFKSGWERAHRAWVHMSGGDKK